MFDLATSRSELPSVEGGALPRPSPAARPRPQGHAVGESWIADADREAPLPAMLAILAIPVCRAPGGNFVRLRHLPPFRRFCGQSPNRDQNNRQDDCPVTMRGPVHRMAQTHFKNTVLIRSRRRGQIRIMDTCPHCRRPLIEIDHYGERLIGRIECNRWSWPEGGRLFMELPEDDLEALRERVRPT